MHSKTRVLILLLAVSMLALPPLKGDDASSVLSNLPVPQGAKVMKTTSSHGDRTLIFSVQGESSKIKDWILQELKKQGWGISDQKAGSDADKVLDAQKSGLRLNVSFTQSGPAVLVTYGVLKSSPSSGN